MFVCWFIPIYYYMKECAFRLQPGDSSSRKNKPALLMHAAMNGKNWFAVTNGPVGLRQYAFEVQDFQENDWSY